jgi:hypothetical protein
MDRMILMKAAEELDEEKNKKDVLRQKTLH